MAAPKAWAKGRLYLAPDNSSEASPLPKVVDFSYSAGANNEETPFAGASKVTRLSLLGNPNLAINFIRDSGSTVVGAAARHWRDVGTGVKFYLYLDITGEAAVYAYGYAAIDAPALTGGAVAGQKGSLTLAPGPEDVWDDAALVY